MSNFLAIATVTATLQQTLQSAVGAVVSGATVKTVRPEASANGAPDPHVNLYLYQVTPNAAWRNADLPLRSPSGNLVDRPQVAFDLHYLLSFYGDESKFEPQRLLGSVAQAFHSHPVLTRQMIRKTVVSPSFPFLEKSDLADEVELVKFTPVPLSLEELSKLWSVFFQTPYALSIAYHGSVVLIESNESYQQALPVRERKTNVTPFRQLALGEVPSQAGPGQPLRPTIIPPILTTTVVTPSGVTVTETVTVKLKPDVGREQCVVLLLNELGNDAPRGYSFSAPSRANTSDSITIPIHGVKAADYLVRVQIDGAESPLIASETGQYESPRVTIL